MTKRLLLLVPLVLGPLAACGGSDDPAEPAAASAPSAEVPSGITIEDFAFSPDDATFSVGDTVTVANVDAAAHTLTADDEAFDTGDIDGGGNAELTFDQAGTFSYHCAIHTYMEGTVTVTE